jgi:hypothetical protein
VINCLKKIKIRPDDFIKERILENVRKNTLAWKPTAKENKYF